jgi:hypothetical protein
MKQKDIALIVAVVAVSGLISFLASRWLFAKPGDRQQKAEVVDVIASDFTLPDTKYFNTNAVDPTQLIQIGGDNNPNPFGSGN